MSLLALYKKKFSFIYGLEIQRNLSELAELNAEKNGFSENFQVISGDFNEICADFSGNWTVTQTAYSDCYGYETTVNGSTIIQTGCDVSFNVDGFTGYTDGSVEGDTLTLQPVTFTLDSEATTYSNWSLVIDGDSITGSASWDYYSNFGTVYECSGTSTFSGTRQ